MHKRPNLERFARYDFFISYKHDPDSTRYASALERKLKSLGYHCFLDTLRMRENSELIPALDRALNKSKCLILVGTKRAFKSTWIAVEVVAFLRGNRHIVAIDADRSGAARDMEGVFSMLKGFAFESEEEEAFGKGEPSMHVIDRLSMSLKFWERDERLKRYFIVTAILLVLAVLTSWVIAVRVNKTFNRNRTTATQE